MGASLYMTLAQNMLLLFTLGGGGAGGRSTLRKSKKVLKSISGILGWVLTFLDPKF